MNKLNEAAEALKNGWCKGSYRQELPDNETFCALGALNKALIPGYQTGMDIIQYENHIDDMLMSPETQMLADVIRENYETELKSLVSYMDDNFNVITTFNDSIAKHSDEVVAMFEKAAAKFDEKMETVNAI